MSEEFYFGEPARRRARLGRGPSRPGRPSVDARVLWVAAGLVLASVLASVVLRNADEAGRRIGDRNSSTVDQIDRAHDAEAQGSIGRAIVVGRSLHAERGTFSIDEADLAAYDPGLRFSSGPSSGPSSIAFAATDTALGAAVLSESGTCWWARIDASGTTSYGSGQPCTGTAAMTAADPSW